MKTTILPEKTIVIALLLSGALAVVRQLPVGAQPEDKSTGDSLSPFLYVNNNVPGTPPDNSISAFSVNAGGALSAIAGSPFPTGGEGDILGAINGLVCCGRYLYAANAGEASVSGFVVDPASGSLVPVPGSPVTTSAAVAARAYGVACTPDHSILYVANNSGEDIAEDIRIFDIDTNTGALSPNANDAFDLPPGSAYPIGIQINPAGSLLLVSQALTQEMSGSVGVYRIGAGGALSAAAGSPFPIDGLGSGATVTPDGRYYYVAGLERSINGFLVGTEGTLTAVSGSPAPFHANDVAVDETGTLLFASEAPSGDRIHVLRIEPGSGALTPVEGSPFAHDTSDDPAGLVTAGSLLFVANGFSDLFATTVSAYSFDRATGVLTPVPGSPFQRGVAFPGSPAAAIALCPTATGTVCVGDCDGRGSVTIDELIKGINIALGAASLDQCPRFDTNGSGTVTIDELIKGVNNALTGCPA